MAWYNDNWEYRIPVTFNSGDVPADLSNYPAYIDLSTYNSSAFDHLHDNAKSDGTDIVVTQSDGETKLSRELVWIDATSGYGELYVNTNLSSSVSTKIYIYYGNAGASETNDTDTWRSEYKLVSHYQTNADNSTAYGTDGTNNGAALTTGGGGFRGECYDFEVGDNDYIQYADDPDWDGWTDVSVSCIVNYETANRFQGLVGRLRGGGNTRRWATISTSDTNLRMRITGSTNYDRTVSQMDTSTWYHDHFTFSDSNNRIRIYQQGSQIGSDLSCTESLADGNETITVGEEGYGDYFDGLIDEVRVYSGEWSSDWVSYDYDNKTNFSGITTIDSYETQETAVTVSEYSKEILKGVGEGIMIGML